MTKRRAIVRSRNLPSHAQSPRVIRVVMLAAILSVATAARAQVQVVDHGRALDANPMVGGGGSNHPLQGYVPINTNAIMTGNVTGLGAFQGNEPIHSTLEFSGHLPSASLDHFNAQSAGGYGTPTYTGQMQTFYTPSSVVSTASGQINSGLANGGINPVGASLVGAASANPNSASVGQLGATQLEISATGSPPPTTDFSRLASSTPIPGVDDSETDALFGLRRTLHPDPIVTRVDPDTGQTIQSGALDANAANTGALQQGITIRNNLPPANTMPPNPADQWDPNDPNNPNNQPKIDPNDWGARSRINDARKPDLVNDQVKSSPLVSKPTMPRQPGVTLNAVAVRKPEPFQVSASYESVMDRLKQLSAANLKFQPAGMTAEGAIPDSTRFALPTEQTAAPEYDPVTGQLKPTKPLTQSTDPTRPDYRPRDYSQLPGSSLPGTTVGSGATVGGTAGNGGATQPATAPATANPFTPSPKPASVAELLKRADADLTAGRYMHAAETYELARRLDPTQPDVLLGKAHAELAAGLYESAAYDLRLLFGLRPEAIGASRDIRKFISERRMQYLQEDLKKVAARKEENAAPFLLSYLCYQTSDKDGLKAAMDDWAKKSPNDQWQTILRHLWLDKLPDKH